jgi:UDP-N-acetylglucosamine--N-acetylmuramyl-(pentapeptide) pyrophosphoryl-undecaprenol N-acetylglucosamine transferase
VRLWIAAGGTGGHVYPALAVVERLRDQGSGIGDRGSGISRSDILWIGGDGVEQELVARAGLSYRSIAAGGLHGMGLIAQLRNAIKLIAGTFQAFRLIGRGRPDVLLTTGGFVAAPVAVACWLRRVPMVLYLPDVEPGQAVKFVARFAATLAVTRPESRAYFPGKKVIVTGYPVRAEMLQADRAAAIRRFGLAPDRATLLVTGGSKGARSLNRAIAANLAALLAKAQIIHLSGATDAADAQAQRDALPAELQRHYHVFEYAHAHDMGLALAAADLVISRAGASVLGEYPVFGLPSILVPYPYAWRYQKVNAQALVTQGAAVMLDDATLNATLRPAIEQVLGDATRLAAMRRAARSLARPDAALALAQAVQAVAGAQT